MIRTLVCIQCGQSFPAPRGRGRPPLTCSWQCKDRRDDGAAGPPTSTTPRRDSERWHAQQDRLQAKADQALAALPARTCKQCLLAFRPTRSNNREYCGALCRRRAFDKTERKRAREMGAAYEPVKRVDLFSRDGWKCQICGASTPRRLMGKVDPRAPEVEHRVPLSKGGAHTYENCQTACRSCNIRKGNRYVVGQMNLFPRPAHSRPTFALSPKVAR